NAINGSGGDILSFINVADDDGQGLDNAYWNGAAMFYGNGRNGFDPLAGSLDVGGHEMSHGVIQETANLVYQDEPGALNESFADIFGVMIDRDDWFLGEDITRTSFIATGRLRDMSDPHNGGNSLADNGWQPSHMDERYTGSQDNGGVHINSGIPNHAYYLYATAIGKADAEQVFYDALTKFLTRSSEFIDARLAVVQAATDRFGANSSQVSAAKTAFDQVGIFNGAPNQPPPDFDPNPGDAYLVSTDYWTGDNGENLYVADAAGNFPGALNVVEPRAKLSVRDDGAFGYYVGIDNHIYEIGLNPNDTQNFGQTSQLSNLPEWNSVAISKDGLKLAAITNFQDASIYVFDFSQASGVRSQIFDLYIPTTGQGNNSLAGVEYADAMDWDPLGEYLIYDSYVVLPNASGPDIDYWDINFMRVWDVNANDFGDGLIIPLFSNLEAGFSVGNPVFSKNSPYILAFDYFNLGTSTFYVISANIETNQINLISTNNTLGFPEFSVNDDQLVYNVANSSTGGSVYRINLAADKITPIGTGSEFISFASFGVWYATGTRVLSSIEDPHGDLPWQLYPNPSRGEITLSLELTRPSPIQISVADLTGRTLLREEQPGQVGKREYALSLSDLAQGTYLVRIEAGGQQWVQMIQRTY
ncbi:MAG: M4 family metallopeptidase, partial [Bacteroidota bacterium]